MKRLFLFSTLLMLAFIAPAQVPYSLNNGEPALIYSLPKTEFCIEVETEKVTQNPGMFFRYSERYLATKNVVTEEKTTYRLQNIRVKARAIPDPNRTYTFVPAKNSQTSHITVNSQGLLCGVNVPCAIEPMKKQEVDLKTVESPKPSTLLRLGEEYMMAGSEAKLAEGAAKQIYRIRESRIGLLTADVEHVPADGSSLASMLEGMNKLEQEMTELFVGKTTKELQTQTIYLVPTAAATNEVLFRISALKGVVAKDDLGGVPYYISIAPSKIPAATAAKVNKVNALLYSIQPASTQISIGDGVNTFFAEQYFVPQFGVTVPLADELFKQPKLKIYIDSQTGRLLTID